MWIKVDILTLVLIINAYSCMKSFLIIKHVIMLCREMRNVYINIIIDKRNVATIEM